MDREGWGTNWLGMGDGDGTRHRKRISHVVFKSVFFRHTQSLFQNPRELPRCLILLTLPNGIILTEMEPHKWAIWNTLRSTLIKGAICDLGNAYC